MVTQAEAANDAEGNAQYVAALEDFFRRYRLERGEPKRDLLEGRYQVQINTPLHEFDRRTARACAASDSIDVNRPLFALVCQPGTVPRHNLIQAYKSVDSPYLLKLAAAGWVPLSEPQQERFVLIYERPPAKKLSELITAGKGALNENFLCKSIIAPIASALEQLGKAGISHGALRPDNIYFSDVPILGDCLCMPCGYDQPFQFEPLERMQALPSAKGNGSVTQDYYALAVTVLTLLYGHGHFANTTPQALMAAIMREGVYNAMTRGNDAPEMFHDFFRGLLTAGAQDRWSHEEIRPWLDGKRFNVLLPPLPGVARPFEFGEVQASSRRELAHVLFQDWGRVASVLENGQLAQWITVSLKDKELAEAVTRIGRSALELAGKNEVQYNEQIMRLLLLLDPSGPIRIGTLSMHPDGIDALCAELFQGKMEKELTALARFIEFNMVSFWLDLQRKNPAYAIPDAVNAIMMKMEKLRLCIRNTGYGFGIERMLYELNPDLPCQSPLFTDHQVASLPFLLTALDQLAPSLHAKDDPLDRHIAAFIGAKANIQYEIRLHELAALPGLATHRAVIALKLLAAAQQKTEALTLPGLTHWLALRIAAALGNIRSRTLRVRMGIALVENARTGSLTRLAELIINPSYATADQTGFGQAWSLYQMNALEITRCRKGDHIDQQSDRLGLAMAKLFAFIALGITLFSVFKGVS